MFTVITPLCVFRKQPGQKFLALDSICPYTTVEEVKENTGWEIEETKVPTMEPPTTEELAAIKKVDVNDILSYEFKEAGSPGGELKNKAASPKLQAGESEIPVARPFSCYFFLILRSSIQSPIFLTDVIV